MKINEFLKEDNGHYSSTRLFAFLITIATIVDWMHAVFHTTDGVWRPEYQTIAMVLGVLGFKVWQKNNEQKMDAKPDQPAEPGK
jgi:hypothetical protein